MTNDNLEEFLMIADLESSQHPFVANVRITRQHIDSHIKTLSEGAYGSSEGPVAQVTLPIEWQDRPRGFGYLASTMGHSAEKDLIWTAVIAQAFTQSDAGYHPLVVPIDRFYGFMSFNASLCAKTEYLSREKKEDKDGKNHAIILSGLADSCVFTEQILKDIPSQKNAGLDIYGKTTPIGQALDRFASSRIPALLNVHGRLSAVTAHLASYSNEDDARLLLATSLLLQDRQTWQGLWYESSKTGVPLYIVGPFAFHAAMNRLNETWGHGTRDYAYRAAHSLGSNRYPPFEKIGDTLKTHDDFLRESIGGTNHHGDGLSAEEFSQRVMPLLEKTLRDGI